jgi:alanine racemase
VAVKADAYGHGLLPVARVLSEEGVDWLGVAIVEEGIRLREVGIETPILVLGGVIEGSEAAALDARLTPVLYRAGSAERFAALARTRGREVAVQLKVDTGMNRLGVPTRDLASFLDRVEALEGLRIDGVMTHLAEAEAGPSGMTSAQLDSFAAALELVSSRGHRPRWVHAANSAAVLIGQGLSGQGTANLVRPGIMLYGCTPRSGLEESWDLEPVMAFETAISFLKEVPVGARLSYGATWEARRVSRIATLPVGYGDGYARALGNRAEVLIRGQRAPVVGRVCMDLCLVDVTDIEGVDEGDLVTLLGRQGAAQVTAEELAGHLETIPYEILCSISPRVPRIYSD